MGVIQTAIGIYIAECATPATKGFFYGLFWFFYMMSMTLGSLIGAAVLSSGVDETYFYVVLASMALVASLSFLFTRKPLPHDATVSNDLSEIQRINLSLKESL